MFVEKRYEGEPLPVRSQTRACLFICLQLGRCRHERSVHIIVLGTVVRQKPFGLTTSLGCTLLLSPLMLTLKRMGCNVQMFGSTATRCSCDETDFRGIGQNPRVDRHPCFTSKNQLQCCYLDSPPRPASSQPCPPGEDLKTSQEFWMVFIITSTIDATQRYCKP